MVVYKNIAELSNSLGLCQGTINTILCRAEFTKHKFGKQYEINVNFVDELYKILKLKEQNSSHCIDKYRKANTKLLKWRNNLLRKK